MTITQYEKAHLPGILALCEAEAWPSLQSDGHIQAHLSQMAVHREYRRKGVGRVLLEYAGPLIYPS